MKNFIIKTLIQSLAILLVAHLLPGIHVKGIIAAMFAAFVFGVINALVKPLLILLTLPATILTLGFFILLINGFCFWLASALVPGFEITSAFSAILGAILVSIVSWFLNYMISDSNSDDTPQAPPTNNTQDSTHIKVIKAKVIHQN